MRWLIFIWLLLNIESGKAQDPILFYERELIRLEEYAWKNADHSEKNKTYLQRAILLKDAKKHKRALQELDRIAVSGKDSFLINVAYEKAINSFMLNDFTRVTSLMERDSLFTRDTEKMVMYLSSLIETNEWVKVRHILMESAACVDTLLCRMIKQLNTAYAVKNSFLSRTLSSFIPGAGQLAAGYPGKGLTSLSIHAVLGVWIVYNISAGFYITAAVSGVAPLIKFYSGNRRLSFRLAEKQTAASRNKLKGRYYKALSVILPARN